MTRTRSWMAALTLMAVSIGPALAAGSSPIGQWQVTTGEARYVVSACGGRALCAKLVWLRADARTGDNLALLNHYVVKGAKPQGGGIWLGNVTFSGHSYDGTMTMVSRNFMTLQGCSGILCQTYEFTRN
jgi:uncharacterized protein (DUF2147 family)